MRIRAVLTGIAAGLLLASAPLAAQAATTEPPLDLAGAYVLDVVGALGGREAEVEAALDDLYERAEAGLFVVIVDGFDTPSEGEAWAAETATLSGLGDADILLAIGATDRTAWFTSALAVAWPDGPCVVVQGEVHGQLTFPPRGDRGFGYDPLFIPTGGDQTFGEMEPAAKDAISHRTVAFAKLRAALID